MSEANADNPMTAKQLIGVVLAAIVGIPVLIFLLVKLFTSGLPVNPGSPTMTNEAVVSRIQPIGYAKLDESGPPGSRNGKAVFESVCMSCHGTGLAGAPKQGDAAAWGPRISKGFATLVEHAVKGFNAMPAKGGAADLTDDEVARAVAYMGNAAGAKFTEPAVQGAGASTAAVDPAVKGKEVYDSVCMACHASGTAGAPKLGDKAAWAPRTKGGLDALVESAAKGKGAMPPKGGYSGSDEEFRAAVTYIVNASK
ncbi:c-type cytochrome [Chitinimonas lacunae]|uniref:C-type cytochrome n=1 Tax=Chitinimonas lacunae TaxID=1963018 RepID=A0ABV8MR60_9NEIS